MVDVTLAEYCMSLWLLRQKHICGVYPLMVGLEHAHPSLPGGTTLLDNLFHNEEFREVRNALPRVPNAPTWRFVRKTLTALGETLPAEWERLSVYDIMCASERMAPESSASSPALPPFSGMLIKDAFVLDGPKDKLRLMLREFSTVVKERIWHERVEVAG